MAYITSNRYRYRDTDTEPKDTQLQKEILCLVSGEVYVVACSLCLIIGFRLIASVLESKTAHEKLHQKGKKKRIKQKENPLRVNRNLSFFYRNRRGRERERGRVEEWHS